MKYLVRFRNGSTDYVEANSAAEARELAESMFGGKVTRVLVCQERAQRNPPRAVREQPDEDFDEDEDEDEDAEEDEEEEDEEDD